jgi:hypothetical protein
MICLSLQSLPLLVFLVDLVQPHGFSGLDVSQMSSYEIIMETKKRRVTLQTTVIGILAQLYDAAYSCQSFG